MQRETSVHMEVSLINANVSCKRVTSIPFSEPLLCLQLLKITLCQRGLFWDGMFCTHQSQPHLRPQKKLSWVFPECCWDKHGVGETAFPIATLMGWVVVTVGASLSGFQAGNGQEPTPVNPPPLASSSLDLLPFPAWRTLT